MGGKANFAFCVNNGICKGKVKDGEDHPGCTCPEGYSGNHCEYLGDDDEDSNNNGSGDDSEDTKAATKNNNAGDHSDVHSSGGGLPVSSSSNISINEKSERDNQLIIVVSSMVLFMVIAVSMFLVYSLMCVGGASSNKDVQGALDEQESSSDTIPGKFNDNGIGS